MKKEEGWTRQYQKINIFRIIKQLEKTKNGEINFQPVTNLWLHYIQIWNRIIIFLIGKRIGKTLTNISHPIKASLKEQYRG